MPRAEINRSGEMEVFVRVVENGGFSAAARRSDMTPSAVSKLIARLEARLGSRLVNRSTRQLQLTAEGRVFYDKAVRILADIAEAELSAGAAEAPRGRVRINTSASYGNHILAKILDPLLERYPELAIDVVQTDAMIDLLAERTDIAVRAGPMSDSRLLARKLGETRLVIVGSPAYLAKHGAPRDADALQTHRRLGFGYQRALRDWPALKDGETVGVPAIGRVSASDGEGLRHLAIAGVGLARLAEFTVRDDIAAGRLVPVLDHPQIEVREAFHAVYVGRGGPLPSRVRAVLDFIADHGRVS